MSECDRDGSRTLQVDEIKEAEWVVEINAIWKLTNSHSIDSQSIVNKRSFNQHSIKQQLYSNINSLFIQTKMSAYDFSDLESALSFDTGKPFTFHSSLTVHLASSFDFTMDQLEDDDLISCTTASEITDLEAFLQKDDEKAPGDALLKKKGPGLPIVYDHMAELSTYGKSLISRSMTPLSASTANLEFTAKSCEDDDMDPPSFYYIKVMNKKPGKCIINHVSTFQLHRLPVWCVFRPNINWKRCATIQCCKETPTCSSWLRCPPAFTSLRNFRRITRRIWQSNLYMWVISNKLLVNRVELYLAGLELIGCVKSSCRFGFLIWFLQWDCMILVSFDCAFSCEHFGIQLAYTCFKMELSWQQIRLLLMHEWRVGENASWSGAQD